MMPASTDKSRKLRLSVTERQTETPVPALAPSPSITGRATNARSPATHLPVAGQGRSRGAVIAEHHDLEARDAGPGHNLLGDMIYTPRRHLHHAPALTVVSTCNRRSRVPAAQESPSM